MNNYNMVNTELIEETDFHRAWYSAVKFILNRGTQLRIGHEEHQSEILDACILVELTGNSINQILNRELHPDYPFKSIDTYCREFTDEYLEEYQNKPENEKFSYLYYERLKEYPTIHVSKGGLQEIFVDQLDVARVLLWKQCKKNYTNNACIATTWIPLSDEDYMSARCKINPKNTPCLQWIGVRLIGDNKVDIHMDFRSRDIYAAWQANVVCITNMINNKIVKPNKCSISRITDFSRSAHIYLPDLNAASKIRSLPL